MDEATKLISKKEADSIFVPGLRESKREFKEHILPEIKRREFFKGKGEKRRFKSRKGRRPHVKRVSIEASEYLASWGIRLSSRKKKNKITDQKNQSMVFKDQINTSDPVNISVPKISESDMQLNPNFSFQPDPSDSTIPQLSFYVPIGEIETPTQSSVVQTHQTQSQYQPPARIEKNWNYVSTFIVIRFVSGDILEKLRMIGRLEVGFNVHVGIFTIDLPESEIVNIKWGDELRPEWEERLKAVSPAFVDALVEQGKLMPNHIKTWSFYKSQFPQKLCSGSPRFALVWDKDRRLPSFPGGSIESGERPRETIVRESKEETNLDVS